MKLKKLLTLLCIGFISACGFQLRGTAPMPEIMQRIAIQPNDPYLPLQRDIREMLKVNNVAIVDMTQHPTAILQITQDTFQVTDTSIGADGRIREQGYNYVVSFLVTDAKGKTLMGPETIQSQRIIEYNPDTALSQSLEEKIVRNETRLEVVGQLVRRLAYVNNGNTTKP